MARTLEVILVLPQETDRLRSGLSGRPNPKSATIARIPRKHTNLDPRVLPDSPSRSHNAMGRLWNRLLSRSVAPMLIADVGGILPPPPKSPCPSAPNHPTSTTMRSQDPNRQSQSPTGPGTGAGLPQRQRHTLGHHAPSKIRGAPNTGLCTVRARVGELWPKTRPKRKPTCIQQKPEGWFIPPRPHPNCFGPEGGAHAHAHARLAHQDGRLSSPILRMDTI